MKELKPKKKDWTEEFKGGKEEDETNNQNRQG